MKLVAFFAAAIAFVAISAAPAAAKKCPSDSVKVGPACIDTYEASVWFTTDASLVKRIQNGKVVDALDLIGATQQGVGSDDYGTGCPDTAAGCTDYYAVSIPGIPPSVYLTWSQAQAACRNAGKRLATNAEWQAAAYGTPDPGTDNGSTDCNVSSTFVIANTGSRSSCLSDVGAYDMVGNVEAWVADWGDPATDVDTYPASFGNDVSSYGGAPSAANTSDNFPSALTRGGGFIYGPSAGMFTVSAAGLMILGGNSIGFRCAR